MRKSAGFEVDIKDVRRELICVKSAFTVLEMVACAASMFEDDMVVFPFILAFQMFSKGLRPTQIATNVRLSAGSVETAPVWRSAW